MKLTERSSATGLTLNQSFLHIVNTNDTSQDPAGSSYKAPLSLLTPLFGGGSFTGNTSGDCITDLYITNLYGCSPVTVHDSLQHITSSGTGMNSIAWGFQTLASGDYSHAEGGLTTASGTTSHAEGVNTLAGGIGSHAEGTNTIASGKYSHAEGRFTRASGDYSHAEGGYTTASGNYCHAEGYYTTATTLSHTEGQFTLANAITSHAEGTNTTASGSYSHAEGTGSVASGTASHAEGDNTKAIGDYSHSEGGGTFASGRWSHAGGRTSTVSGDTSFIHSSNSLVIAHRSVVLGGQNITGTTNDTVYVPNLNIVMSYTPSSSGDTIGNVGSITWDDTYVYVKTNSGWGRALLDYAF
jgi:hypothetical protein